MASQRYISELPALALSDLKRAALFFDQLIACYWFDHNGVYGGPGPDGTALFRSTVEVLHEFEEIQKSGIALKLCTARTTRKTPYIFEENRFHEDDELIIHYITEKSYEAGQLIVGNWDACGRYDETLDESEVTKYGIAKYREDAFRKSLDIVRSKLDAHDVFGWASMQTRDEPESVNITLAKVQLVDTRALHWDQIAELRKDTQALDDLRRLRRFVVSNMQGLPQSYVEDELAEALRKHESATQSWGIKTLPGEINVDYEGTIAMGMVTAISVALAGASISEAATIGALVPLGQALIAIGRGRKRYLANSRVGYLAAVKRRTRRKS